MTINLPSILSGLGLASTVALTANAQAVGYSCTAQPQAVLQSLSMTNGCGIVRDLSGREVSGCCFIAPEGAMFDGPVARAAEPVPEVVEPSGDETEGPIEPPPPPQLPELPETVDPLPPEE